MVHTQPVELMLEVGFEDADEDQLDHLTRQFLGDLRDLDIESARLVKRGPAPAGTKTIDASTLGAIALVVLPTVLPKLIDFAQSWMLRKQGRSIKFKGSIGGPDIEFEGSPEDFKAFLINARISLVDKQTNSQGLK